MTRMLSLDTSTTNTGVALWENGELKYTLSLSTPKDEPRKDMAMIERIISFIRSTKPDIVICEDLNVVNNIAVAKKLASIIGAINGVCIYNGIFFDKLPPTSWRRYITIDGDKPPRARKDVKLWDIKQVVRLFNILPANDDEADAILIGEAYKRMCNEGVVDNE